MPLPLYGQLLLGSGHEHGSARDGQSGRQLDQYLSSRHALVQVKSQCAPGAPVTVGVSQVYALFGGSSRAYIDAWQVAVFIALRAESVDT